MKTNLLSLTLLAALTCTVAKVDVKAQCQSLVWSDEFNADKLNSTFWNIEVNGTGGGNNELQYYTDRPENIRLEGGNLVIEARKETYLGKEYTSGRITTQKKISWTYGTIEARMKLPYGKGMWPAFWMLGENINTAPWPNCGEMDIMELVGGTTGDKTVHSTFHWGPVTNGNHPSYGVPYSLTSGIFADDFHVFKLVWDNKQASTYVDGVKMFSIDISKAGLEAFHSNFFVLLNLAVGGNWPGAPDANTVFPQKMLVDYVRVYGNTESLKIEGDTAVMKSQKNLVYKLPYDPSSKYAWTVPAGVTINGRADSCVVSLNWGCNPETISCAITSDCGVTTKSLAVKVKDYAITSSSFFIPASGTDLVFSLPDFSDATYNWTVPADATINSGQSTSSVSVAWGTNTGRASVELKNACETKTVSIPVFKPGSYAYPNPLVKHAIPGAIEATDFNYGGEGVAYHDVEADNQGKGNRVNEGVDTEVGDNTFDVGWTIAGEWLTYTVQPVAGEYFAEVRTGSQPGGGALTVSFNGVDKLSNSAMPSTGAWNVFQSTYLGSVTLTEKDTLMKVSIVKGDVNISRFIFWPKDNEAPTKPAALTGVVAKTSIALKWNKSTDNQKLLGYKVFDNGLLKKTLTDTTFSLTISSSVANHHIGVIAYDMQGNESDTLTGDFKALNTAISTAEAEKVSVYPNPVSNQLTVVYPFAKNSTVIISNAAGQIVTKISVKNNSEKIELPVDALKAGYYILTVVDSERKTSVPFVKE
jgi:beta-glucanase (GH16 family)